MKTPKAYTEFSRQFSKTHNAFPEEFANKIIQADSLEILKQLPDNCVDLIFTSPPYNFGMAYDKHQDKTSMTEYFQMLWQIFDECIRVVKYGGRIVINIQPLFSDYVPTHHMISQGFIQRGLIWKAEILWEKNHRNCATTAWGSWRSPASPYFKYTWEYLEVFCKGHLKHAGLAQNADITANEFKTWTTARWSISPERKMREHGHPAMFPTELAYRVLKLFSFQTDIVLDPFNGAGTTSLVAQRTGRRYLGIDISEAYCAQAEHRLQHETLRDFAQALDDNVIRHKSVRRI